MEKHKNNNNEKLPGKRVNPRMASKIVFIFKPAKFKFSLDEGRLKKNNNKIKSAFGRISRAGLDKFLKSHNPSDHMRARGF